ncbi:hypothetical protein [Pseudomonas fluorescens]|uniref:Uncharacterized protein n=1 Tax=Pseudomonas fluorescens TaxID=294 RepID=A0A944HEN6_PSEFL|nr:hypothetical protein [Pseudomonas fluorescens]MBT2294518.1 hypothetical protein [Pseudomonas fluorescens]MBT2306826.1 hypothetical protein [Pseudomonas fluorescens]MBT2316264.1 hypothetical protein [Pseudomonas fluorescens]MBT2331601.1 hypothetical protein [Pseudomonas fluorescens]MBT2342769.1 hypothetical protein [Pseudomonas fluorescens]
MNSNYQSPIPNNAPISRPNGPFMTLKAQVQVQRIAELRALGEMARLKACTALRAETAASAGFIRAVVELSGAAPELPVGA